MGSSAASAAAAAWAVNGLFGAPLSKADLIPAGLASEATVSGYHADNIGPALMGGFVLIRCVGVGEGQRLVLVAFALPTGIHPVLPAQPDPASDALPCLCPCRAHPCPATCHVFC
jgi:homoserine kinase